MKISDCTAELRANILARIPSILWGPPGVGKTDVTMQTAAALGYSFLVSHPVTEDPTEAKGLPWMQDGKADHVPFGTLRAALESTLPTIWLLDDFGQATQAVQGAYMQLLLGRRLNGHILPDCVHFVLATNRHDDGAGAGKLITPVLNRCAQIDVEVDADEWQQWAAANDIDPSVRAFLRMRPDLLHKFTKAARAFPSPRSWAFVSRKLPHTADERLLPACTGLVGQGADVEYVAYRRDFWQKMPDLDAILGAASTMTVPSNISVIWAIGAALVDRAKKVPRDLKAAGTFIGRFPLEAAAKTFVDLIAAVPNAINSPPLVEFCTSHPNIFGTKKPTA